MVHIESLWGECEEGREDFQNEKGLKSVFFLGSQALSFVQFCLLLRRPTSLYHAMFSDLKHSRARATAVHISWYYSSKSFWGCTFFMLDRKWELVTEVLLWNWRLQVTEQQKSKQSYQPRVTSPSPKRSQQEHHWHIFLLLDVSVQESGWKDFNFFAVLLVLLELRDCSSSKSLKYQVQTSALFLEFGTWQVVINFFFPLKRWACLLSPRQRVSTASRAQRCALLSAQPTLPHTGSLADQVFGNPKVWVTRRRRPLRMLKKDMEHKLGQMLPTKLRIWHFIRPRKGCTAVSKANVKRH